MKAKPSPHDTRPISPGRKKAPRPVLTDEQATWLKRHYRTFGNYALSEKLGIKITHLKEIVKAMGLSKKADKIKVKPIKPAVERPVAVKVDPKPIIVYDRPKPFVRPPAQYGNRSQEEVINYYLNL